MTAVQASDDTYHTNGQHYFNGKAAYHSNGTQNGDRAAFSKDVFSHLTLFTGNTMVTGTTGLLNSTSKKSNQEVRMELLCDGGRVAVWQELQEQGWGQEYIRHGCGARRRGALSPQQ